jgi:hypothetical protein
MDWPWRRPAENSNSDFRSDRKTNAAKRRTLDPEWVPEPPQSGVDGRGLWKITLRTGGFFALVALFVWVAVSVPGLRLIGDGAVQTGFSASSISTYLGALISPLATATKAQPEASDGQPVFARGAAGEPGRTAARELPSRTGPRDSPPPPIQSTVLAAPTAQTHIAALLPATAATPAAREPALPRRTPDFVIRQIDRDELVSLLHRADEFIRSGDLSSARLLLRRTAEAGYAQGTLALAGTFDPNVLSKLGFQAGAADVAMARLWYERAETLGSTEAQRRLQQLSIMGNSAR